RRCREGIELRALQPEVRSLVFGDFAAEEPADDLDALLQPLQPDWRLWPVVAGDMFVQRLTRAQPKIEATGIHCFERRGCLRQYRGRGARPRRRDARAEEAATGLRADRPQPRPDERRLTLLRHPRMKMVGRHDGAKASILRLPRPS